MAEAVSYRSILTDELRAWLHRLADGPQPPPTGQARRTSKRAIDLGWSERRGDVVTLTDRGREVVAMTKP